MTNEKYRNAITPKTPRINKPTKKRRSQRRFGFAICGGISRSAAGDAATRAAAGWAVLTGFTLGAAGRAEDGRAGVISLKRRTGFWLGGIVNLIRLPVIIQESGGFKLVSEL